MKLYLIQCGYYEDDFEYHTTFFKVGKNEADVKTLVKHEQKFKDFKMHIDGIKAIESIDGYIINIQEKNEN